MRAARALDMLLILQRKGRTSARILADELEVSERTILRDVQVLSEAGVPIYTTQGVRGGIELLDGFETNLTGLTTDEALTLFLAGQPHVAHRLGLGKPARTARSKLIAALPEALANQADTLADWFIQDPDPWDGHRIPHGELRRISTCIRRRREIELRIGPDPGPTIVRPLGLVLKAGSWHLVHAKGAEVKAQCIDDLRATRITNSSFDIPAEFSLSTFWGTHVAAQHPHPSKTA